MQKSAPTDHRETPGPHLPVPAPVVVEGELVPIAPREVRYTRAGGRGMRIVGGPIVDERDIARIRARVEYGDLPWWRRLLTQTPEGW